MGFTLSRPASVKLVIETPTGVVVRDLGSASLGAGRRSIVWDGRLPQGSLAFAGSYVAHVYVTSATGASDESHRSPSDAPARVAA